MDHQCHFINMSYNACREKSNYKLYYDRFIVTDRTNRSDRPDIVLLGKTVKEAHSTDVAIANRHNLLRAIA